MDISPIIRIIGPPELENGRWGAELKPGDRLTGRVLRIEHDGRILLDLGNARVSARSDIPLSVGQELRLRVNQVGALLWLRLDGEITSVGAEPITPFAPADVLNAGEQAHLLKIIGRLLDSDTFGKSMNAADKIENPAVADNAVQKHTVFANEQVRYALQQLKSLFSPLDPAAPVEQQAQWLRMAIEDRGLFFENKLADVLLKFLHDESDGLRVDAHPDAMRSVPESRSSITENLRQIVARDLKGQLLVLGNFFNTPDEGTAGTLKDGETAHLSRTVDLLLSYVERQQEQVSGRSGGDDYFQVFQHLLSVRQPSQAVRLKIYYPKKGRLQRSGPGHNMALLLDMDRLGPVRIDLGMMERQLSITFYVRDRRVRDVFDTHIPAVAVILERMFDQVRIATRVSRQKIARFELEDRRSGSPVGGIDLHA